MIPPWVLWAALAEFLAFCGILSLLTRLPKCPRCGKRDWVANPHLGPYSAYCRSCLKQVDFSGWNKQ